MSAVYATLAMFARSVLAYSLMTQGEEDAMTMEELNARFEETPPRTARNLRRTCCQTFDS